MPYLIEYSIAVEDVIIIFHPATITTGDANKAEYLYHGIVPVHNVVKYAMSLLKMEGATLIF